MYGDINEIAKLIFNPMSMENDITFANLLLLSHSILPLSHRLYLRLYLYTYSEDNLSIVVEGIIFFLS